MYSRGRGQITDRDGRFVAFDEINDIYFLWTDLHCILKHYIYCQ